MNTAPDTRDTTHQKTPAPAILESAADSVESMVQDLAAEVPAYRARLAGASRQPRARQDSDHPALQAAPDTKGRRAASAGGAPRTTERQRRAQGLRRLAVHRLTDRDLWLLDMLLEHRILTSEQIAQLAFGTLRRASDRLTVLHQLGLLDRIRPYRPRGSAPMHYLLAPAGAELLAATADISVADLGYHPERLARLAVSLQLGHDVGANGVFTALAQRARTTPGHQLRVWWSARRCLTAWHGLIRPDGYGRWRAPRSPVTSAAEGTSAAVEVDFFLEFDTGTEKLSRLTQKLEGYAQLAAASGLPTLVLFWLPNFTRETHVHQAIAAWQHTRRTWPRLPIATAVPYAVTSAPTAAAPASGTNHGTTGHSRPSWAGPGDAVWLPVDPDLPASRSLPTGARLHLGSLASFQQASAVAGATSGSSNASYGSPGDEAQPEVGVETTKPRDERPAPAPHAPLPLAEGRPEAPTADSSSLRGAH